MDIEVINELESSIEKKKEFINSSMDEMKKISIDELSEYIKNIIDNIDNYNTKIDLWYDDNYKNDFIKLINNLENVKMKNNKYQIDDYISIN